MTVAVHIRHADTTVFTTGFHYSEKNQLLSTISQEIGVMEI